MPVQFPYFLGGGDVKSYIVYASESNEYAFDNLDRRQW